MIFDKTEKASHICYDMNKLFELLNLLEFILKLNSRCAHKIWFFICFYLIITAHKAKYRIYRKIFYVCDPLKSWKPAKLFAQTTAEKREYSYETYQTVILIDSFKIKQVRALCSMFYSVIKIDTKHEFRSLLLVLFTRLCYQSANAFIYRTLTGK